MSNVIDLGLVRELRRRRRMRREREAFEAARDAWLQEECARDWHPLCDDEPQGGHAA